MFVLLSAILAVHCATLRQGHIWGDDFALYIHHAKNIADHAPYTATGFIYNPQIPAYSPRSYPPVFPLMLAPLVQRFGINVMPMKMEQIAIFFLTLIVVFALWRAELGLHYALALVAILGFSPVFVGFKENVLSDLPFLLFFYLVALLVTSMPAAGRWWLWAPLIGVALYAAMGTRSAGIALPAGLALYDVARCRKIRGVTIAALGICIGLTFAQRRLTGFIAGSYLEQTRWISWHSILRNVWEYSRALPGFWVGSVHQAFSYVVLVPVLALTLAGLYLNRGRGITIVEALLLPYGAIILLWPFSAGGRLAFPFIPWAVFLALRGSRQVAAAWNPGYAITVLLLLLAGPNIEAYHKMDFGPIYEDAGLAEFGELCRVVRNHTDPGDVFICYRPRSLALYTDREASTYNYLGTDTELWQWSREIHASYLITTTAYDKDGGFLQRFVDQYPASLTLTYRNPKFSLYRIRSIPQ